MAMKWWGTVNLPAVVAARCMIHAITGLARADSRLMVRLLTWRIGRRGGVGWGGSWCMHEDETLLYIPPWAVLLHRPETLGAYPEIRPLSSRLPAAGALGSWAALGRKPAISATLGMEMGAIGMR